MNRTPAYTRRLRRSPGAKLFALFGMLLQVLFAAEHASAMAVSAALGGPTGQSLGFLDICTAEGLVRIPTPPGSGLDERPSPRPHTGGESCSICMSAAASGPMDTPVIAPLAVIPHLLQTAVLVPVDRHIASTGHRRSGSTRGPPSC